MRALGAKVILTPAAERGTGMVCRAEELAAQTRLVFSATVPEPSEPGLSRKHHRPRDFARLRRRSIDYWVTGWGTGGTLSGAGRTLKAARSRI